MHVILSATSSDTSHLSYRYKKKGDPHKQITLSIIELAIYYKVLLISTIW